MTKLLKAQPAVPADQLVKLPRQSDFARLVGSKVDRLDKLVELLTSNQIGPEEFASAFHHDILVDGHSQCWRLGRQRAGDLTAGTFGDLLVGIAKADEESEFLNRFLSDLAGDRYRDADGLLKAKPILARSKLYIAKLRGTAGEAFVEAAEPEEEFEWVMGGVEHCQDCPQLAALGPYTKSTILAFPGSGDTDCLGHCKCHLVRSDGRASFKPVKL